jgi:ribosome recycling factor
MDQYLKEFEDNLRAAVAKFKDEVKGVRSSRPSVEVVEDIKVPAYGQIMEIKQLGSITIGAQREVIITLWDKEVIQPVMKAIEDAKIGLSLKNDGLVIRGFLPALSEERRQEFMKLAKRMSEDARISVRMVREETMKKLKSAEDSGELNKDTAFKAKEKAQKLVDNANAEIEKNLEAKVRELGE